MTGFRLHLFQNEQVLDYTVAQLTFPLFQNDQSSYIFYSEMNRVQTFSFQKVSFIPTWTEFRLPVFQNSQSSNILYSTCTEFILKWTKFILYLFQNVQNSNILYSNMDRVYSKMNKVYTLFIPKCTEFQHPLFQHGQSLF